MRGRQFPFGWLVNLDAATPPPPVTDEIRLTKFWIEVLRARTAPVITPPPGGGGTVDEGDNPDAGVSLCNEPIVYVWLELTTDSGVKVYAKQHLPLGTVYKEGRVKSFGTIRRAFARDRGGFETATASITLIDSDRVLRGLADTGVLLNKRCDIYASTDEALRAGSIPRRLMSGLVRTYKPLPDLEFRIDLEDYFGSRFSEFSGERQIPTRTVTVDDFPNLENTTTSSTGGSPATVLSPGNPQIVDSAVPILYGLVSDEDEGDAAVGAVPCRYVGKRTVSSFEWDEYLVCGHACKTIQSWFAAESFDAGAVRVKMPVATEGVDFLIPGYPGWALHTGSSNPYRDFNGHRYTVIYARGPRSDSAREGKVPITLNVAGIEDVGDGSGELIDSLPRQIQHLFCNWVLQTYTSGAWPAVPTVTSPYGSPYARWRTTTTEIVKDISAGRLGGSPSDGYLGAFMIGWEGQFHTVRDLVVDACRSCDIDIAINKDGQVFMSMVDPAGTSVKDWGDVVDVLKGTFDLDRDFDRLANRIDYRYRRRYVQPVTQQTPPEAERLPESLREPVPSDWLVDHQEQSDATSIAALGETRIYDLELPFVRDADTADDVVLRILDRLKNGPLYASFDVDLCGTDVENGDNETLDHYGGMTAGGWVDRLIRNEEHTVDLDDLRVRLVARDLQGPFFEENHALLGDSTWSTADKSYTTASAQKQATYWYLSDESTDEYSNGDPSKTLSE